MSVEQNIASMRRCFEEVWNGGNLEVLPELISKRYVSYSTQRGETGRGMAAFEQNVKNWRSAMPDLHLAVDRVAGAGDWLETRLTLTGTLSGGWGDAQLTGRHVYHRFSLFSRYADGKCVEATTCSDSASFASKTGTLLTSRGTHKALPVVVAVFLASLLGMPRLHGPSGLHLEPCLPRVEFGV